MIIVAILSPSGGAGRSSIAGALAAGLGNLGRPVVLMQADPANNMGFQLGLNALPEKGLAQLVLGQATPGEVIQTMEQGFRLLPFGQTASPFEIESRLMQLPDFWHSLFQGEELEDDCVVVIDLPRWPNPYSQQILALSDLNLINLTPDSASILGIDPMVSHLLKARGASYFAMNRFDSSKVLHLDMWTLCKMKLGHRLLPFYLHEDQALPESQAAGIALQQFSPNSQLLEDIQKLCNWIDAEIG